MQDITIQERNKLFIINSGSGFSTLGFDNLFGICKELRKKIIKYHILGEGATPTEVLESEIGTLKQYHQYSDFYRIIGDRKVGTLFNHKTPEKLRRIIESCRVDRNQVRIFYGDTSSGQSFMDEWDMIGHISRSTGSTPTPILVCSGEYGGFGLLDHCIIRIIDVDSRNDLYIHDKFHCPEMDIRKLDRTDEAHLAALDAGANYGVWTKYGEEQASLHAGFSSYGEAAHWVAFMAGNSLEQP